MEFTGERLIPGTQGLEDLYTEHMSRYLLAARLARGERVLDAGCGCGYGTHLMAAAGAVEALGVDISPEAVEFAADRYAHAGSSYRVADCRDLKLDTSYGLITCFELIEHVKEDTAVVNSLARVLDEDGICLISTPNASTYVAGGEEGDNPYHCREYEVGEFRQLLETAFAGVTMLEQRWIDGMLISRGPAAGESGPTDGEAALMPTHEGDVPCPSAYGPAAYFLAACTRRPAPDLPGVLRVAFVACTANMRYRRLKEEFDRRGRWGMNLDRELRERDEVITRLRQEKSELEKEFDERGRWAKDLDAKIEEKDRLIRELMADNERLRRAAAAAGR